MAELANISDTARWVAMYRAIESDKRDALFRDPFARRQANVFVLKGRATHSVLTVMRSRYGNEEPFGQ